MPKTTCLIQFYSLKSSKTPSQPLLFFLPKSSVCFCPRDISLESQSNFLGGLLKKENKRKALRMTFRDVLFSETGFNFLSRGNLGLIDLNSTWISASFLSSTNTINQNGPGIHIPTSESNIWGAWGTSEPNHTTNCSIKKRIVGKI